MGYSYLGYHLKNGFFGFSSTGGRAVLPRIWAVCVRQSCAVFAPLKNAWRNETCVPRRLESRRTRASPLLVCRHGILFRSLRGGSPETGGPAVRIQAVSIQPAYSPGLIFVRRLGASNLRFHGERRLGFSFSESTSHKATCTADEHRFQNQFFETEIRSSLGRLRVAKVFRFQQSFAAFLSQFSEIAKPLSADFIGKSLKSDRGCYELRITVQLTCHFLNAMERTRHGLILELSQCFRIPCSGEMRWGIFAPFPRGPRFFSSPS